MCKVSAWGYREWQRALAEAFLAPAPALPPVALFLDEDEGRRLWPSQADPCGSLVASVRGVLDWSRPSGLFDPIHADVSRWRQGDQREPPPCLPALAATVLAASRMHHDKDGPAHAYFLRLAQLLGADDSEAEALRQQLSDSFDPVAAMWRDLHDWIGRQADLGASTIRDHPHYTRIGYPLSQALVRQSDRARLTSFFAAAQVRQLGLPAPATLLGYLRVWSSRSRGFSGQLENALADPAAEPLLADVVYRLAASWDGRVVTQAGRYRLELRVTLDFSTWRAGWAIPTAEGLEEDTLRLAGGGQLHLAQPDFGRLYRLSGDLPPVVDGFTNGIAATGGRSAAEFAPRPVTVLREDPYAAAWVAEASLEPFEAHVLVVQPSWQVQIEAALEAAADAGWRLIQQPAARPLLPGWVIYHGVTLSDPATFDQAARALGPVLTRSLRPDPAPRPQLTGGLALAVSLGRRHYLAGGEPDLLLPVGPDSRHVEASLDGAAQDPPFLATGFPIPLRRRTPMAPGRHELVVDGETLVFHVHLSSPAPALENRPGGRTGGALPADALASPEEADPQLLRRGGGAWLLDWHGAAREAQEPARGEWAAERGLPASYYYGLLPGPQDAWLVQSRGEVFRPPRRLCPRGPEFHGLDNQSAAIWGRLASSTGDIDDPLWQLYLKAWRSWRDGC